MHGKFCPGEHSQLPFPPERLRTQTRALRTQTGALLKEAWHKMGWVCYEKHLPTEFSPTVAVKWESRSGATHASPADTDHTDVTALTNKSEPGAKSMSHQLTLSSRRAQAQ